MAKKIIVLEREGTINDCKYLFWLDVPATRQVYYADPTATSVYKDTDATELDNIRTGKIKEVSGYKTYEASTTIAQVKADLISMFNSQQTQVNDYNPWIKYGSYWDGSTWTIQGVS